LTRRNLHDNISVVGNTLIGLISEHGHEIVAEDLVSDTWGTEAVEFDWVGELEGALDIKHSKSAEGATKRVTCYQNCREGV
jgi:hypothetical protein